MADMFQLCLASDCRFASYLGTLHFCNSDCLHISICGTSFSFFTFFNTFQTFALGVRFTKLFRVSVRLASVSISLVFSLA